MKYVNNFIDFYLKRAYNFYCNSKKVDQGLVDNIPVFIKHNIIFVLKKPKGDKVINKSFCEYIDEENICYCNISNVRKCMLRILKIFTIIYRTLFLEIDI